MNELQTKTFNLPQVYNESNYLEAGERLVKAGQVLQWELGRWFDSLAWGDKKSVCEQVGMSYPNAKNCGLVYRKFQKSFRSDSLSFKHHKILAIDALNDDQRTELLKQAENENMSSKQLTTARDIFLGRDTAKPVIDLPNTSNTQDSDSSSPNHHVKPPTTTHNTAPAPSNNNTANEEDILSMADNSVYEVRSDPPATYGENKYPEQSYNAGFEANKELANLKQVNIDLVIKYDIEHLRAVRLEGDIRGLKSEITKLEESAIIDGNIIAKLNDQALSNTPKQWVKSNLDVADGSICSKVALLAKEALGLTKDDYSHNREINTWLAMRSSTEIAEIIKEAKGEISSKRKKVYSQANKPVKKRLPTNHKEGTVIEVLARFLPDGVNDTTDMRSALSDGYRLANNISGNLKAADAPELNEYLKVLSADDINQLIQIKKDEIREKARAKRLSRKQL